MTFKTIKTLLLFFVLASSAGKVQAQDSLSRVIPLHELFTLTEKNSQSIKIAASNVAIARQGVEVAKLQRLPDLSTSLSAGYIGDALIIDKNFSSTTSVAVPHFSNSFGIQASQLVFKGNLINNFVESATLQEKLAAINLERNTQDMKLLMAGTYFDLYKLYNQRNVYEQNIELAEQRLSNIQRLFDQGMITRNDLIRSELQLSNLRLSVVVLDNNINILNKQLTTVAGLPEKMLILPDTTLIEQKSLVRDLEFYKQEAQQNQPLVQMAKVDVELSEKELDITKTDYVPSVALFAGNNLMRPITSSSPAIDAYSNGWQAGATLSFDIGSLYKTPKQIKLNRLQIEDSELNLTLQQQNTDIAVNTAYVKYLEAITQTKTLEKNRELAKENYRIIEKKYLNQLALLIDMLDATNAKLDAELQYTNAEINILYTYFTLLNSTGTL